MNQMNQKPSINYDTIRQNIERYGTKKLRDLFLLMEYEDTSKQKMEKILFESLNNKKSISKHTDCWVNEIKFQTKILKNLRLSSVEQKKLASLF